MQSPGRMNILSRFLARFGYVRLKDYGYALSPAGKIVEVVEVEDDRFAPPPWQPVAWQSASSLLPPAPKNPPAPRPLAPPPGPEVDEAAPAPLFKVPGVPATVETAPPGKPANEADEEDAISIDEAPEDSEEWEWKMALARAREATEKDKKDKQKATVRLAAASSPTPFPTSALPLAAPPARKVMDAPRPMNRIPRAEPKNPASSPGRPITRLEPRTVTAQRVVAKATPRTVPPKAPPPGRKSRPMPAAAPPTPSAAATGKERPLPRIARGTASPAADGRPTQPRMALGSGRLAAMRDPSHDVTATDITAVDRAWASMRNEEEDTRVNLVVGSSAEITLDTAVDNEPELEATTVDGKPNGVAIVSVEGGASPLPRLTARLRRQSISN